MKTKLYYGVKMIPSSAGVISVTDPKSVNYNVRFNYECVNDSKDHSINADFLSIKRDGFWIGNAMCMN